MDYLARVFSLSDLEKRRKLQIERQRQLDERVTPFVDQCPREISLYYLSHRERSRRQQTHVMNTSLTGKMNALKNELNQNEIYYDKLEKALESDCFCQKLPFLMKEEPPNSPDPPPSPRMPLDAPNVLKYRNQIITVIPR